MPEFVCERKCQFQGRIWEPGQKLVTSPGDPQPPRHFVTVKQKERGFVVRAKEAMGKALKG